MIDISLISYFADKNGYLEANKAFKIVEEFLAVEKPTEKKYKKAAIIALEYLKDNKVIFKEK